MKVVLAGVVATVASEVIQYALIYSKEEYKALKGQVESLWGRLSKQKEQFVSVARLKSVEKKQQQLENQYKRVN